MENTYYLLPHKWQGTGVATLVDGYREAFAKASELYVLSAFLTEWPSSVKLSRQCDEFLLIIGTDFGTTRRNAVSDALGWLPKRFRGSIRAFNQSGVNFHPKLVLWRQGDGSCYLLVGSSNLTKAAFESNVEANVTLSLSPPDYERAKAWVKSIERRSIEVNRKWLSTYVETPRRSRGANNNSTAGKQRNEDAPVFDLTLDVQGVRKRRAFEQHLKVRRSQRSHFDSESRRDIERLFRSIAQKSSLSRAASLGVYEKLQSLWAATHSRMGGLQWVIKGKYSDYRELARSFVRIIDSTRSTRDIVVRAEMDRLAKARVPTRGAVLTELLCHFYPADFPILDAPVRTWRSRVGFDRFEGGSEGDRYLRLALAMRAALEEPGPRRLGIQNLAELDTLIWFKYSGNG